MNSRYPDLTSFSLTVAEIMETNVDRIDENASCSKAIKQMLSSKVWSLIVQREGSDYGVVTERDILRRCIAKGLNPHKKPVGLCSSSPIITVRKDSPVDNVFSLLVENNIRRVYVSEAGKIVGRISQTGLMGGAIEAFAAFRKQTSTT